ncbi:hypothetical protein V2J09_019337 [Rumex salicifolius]
MPPMTFAAGDKLEIKTSGAWFPATVFCPTENPGDNLMISYISGCDHCIVEFGSSTTVRPPPPPAKHRDFQIGDFVEVFQANECWRKGKLLGFCEESRCTVLIESEELVVNVPIDELRPCLEWIDGSWISPSSDQKLKSEAETGTRRIKLKITCGGTPGASRFSVGNKVEVKSDEKGYEGARYTAKIVGSYKFNKFLVEYDTLKTDDETRLLQEIVNEEDIRPYPPEIPGIGNYKMGQAVDVWYNEGWWEGVISKVIDDLTYIVYFATTKEELMYQRSCLRPHRDWIDGKWVVPRPIRFGPNLKKRVYRRKKARDFGKGSDVEVRSNEEGFTGAMYRAAIVEAKEKSKFLVEYKTLRTEDDSGFLREIVDGKDIRPYPPQIKAQFYEPLQRVDVSYNDGWWEGVVCQVLGSSKYGVYFRSTDEEMEFDRSDLRLHQEWANGQWIISGKDHTLLQRLYVSNGRMESGPPQ